MNFDYTYIHLFGLQIFEPVAILTNFIIFCFCCFYFMQLNKYDTAYSKQTAWFILLMGVSSCFGSMVHGAHYQLGEVFFKSILFTSHALNLFAIYFCFRAAYTYSTIYAKPNKFIPPLVLIIVFILLLLALLIGNFIVVKIPAGVVLIYSLSVHLIGHGKVKDGSNYIVQGIGISFLSIIVHSLKISVDEWFNYKDIAHLIIVVSLIFIFKGAKINSELMLANNKLKA